MWCQVYITLERAIVGRSIDNILNHTFFLNKLFHTVSAYLQQESVQTRLFNLLAPEFILILAHPVYKMWIIHEPNTLELWNKLHFEEKKMESIYHV